MCLHPYKVRIDEPDPPRRELVREAHAVLAVAHEELPITRRRVPAVEQVAGGGRERGAEEGEAVYLKTI